METLISNLKKIMNSEIEYKDKYMKMLINGFLRERDSELLIIQGVVKSLKDKEVISFEDWKKRHIIDTDSFDNYLHNTEGWVEEKQLEKMYFKEQNL